MIPVPEPHVIEEVEKYRRPAESPIPLQLPLEVPRMPPEPSKKEERVITIQL